MNKIIKSINDVIFIYGYFWKYGKRLFALSFLGLFCGPIQSYIGIQSIRCVVDSITEGVPYKSIIILIVNYFIILIIINLYVSIIDNYFWENLMLKINAGVRMEVYKHVISTDYKFFDNPEFYNDYSWTASQLSGLAISSMNIIRTFFSRLLTISTLIVLTATMDSFLILIALISLIIGLSMGKITNKIQYKKSEESIQTNRKQDYIHRLFYMKEYAEEIRITRVGEIFIKKYQENINYLTSINVKYRKKITALYSALNMQEILFTAICMIYLTFRISSSKTLTIGAFSALITASAQLKSTLGQFFGIINEVQSISLHTKKIRAFFLADSSIENNKKEGKKIETGAFTLDISNLHFRYSENQNEILKGVNIKIKSGEKVAIVGENGAGKTTLIKLLLRLYDANEGSISINKQDIKDICLNDLREGIGIAFQNSKIYATNVKDNLRIISEEEDIEFEKALRTFIKYTDMEKEAVNLESQMTKEFYIDGIILSGGQSQLFTLSRLLIKEFGLLILDEPSASLDPLKEYELNKIIMDKTRKSTVIIVSHRLSTVRDADRIYVLSEGIVKEQGTHLELMEQHGKYYEMFVKQAENYVK